VVVHSDDIHVTLEVEAFPQVDEQLSLAGGAPQQRVTTHALVLKKGETSKAVLVEVAGEHRLRLSEPSDRSVDVMATARVLVAPAKAVSLDLSNIPEAGKAGLDFELVVRARDKFGNIDDTFEQAVSLNHDGLPPGHELILEGEGVVEGRVELKRGRGRVRAVRKLPPRTASPG